MRVGDWVFKPAAYSAPVMQPDGAVYYMLFPTFEDACAAMRKYDEDEAARFALLGLVPERS